MIEVVKSTFKTLIAEFREHVGARQWTTILGSAVAPYVLDTVKSLPAIAKSVRDMDLRAQLRLVIGCVRLLENPTSCFSAVLSSDVSVQLRKALTGR